MLNSYFKAESASFPEALKAAFSDGKALCDLKLQMNWKSCEIARQDDCKLEFKLEC